MPLAAKPAKASLKHWCQSQPPHLSLVPTGPGKCSLGHPTVHSKTPWTFSAAQLRSQSITACETGRSEPLPTSCASRGNAPPDNAEFLGSCLGYLYRWFLTLSLVRDYYHEQEFFQDQSLSDFLARRSSSVMYSSNAFSWRFITFAV